MNRTPDERNERWDYRTGRKTHHTALTLRLDRIFEAGESTVNPGVEPMIASIGQKIANTPRQVLVTGVPTASLSPRRNVLST
ncbi:hypothetical protein [Paraburkholderia sp. BR14262]|uniref:hypothetical protein n=1 Tax=Paraburkholderia sp. BR14262 TaxID=3236999 RepID=UPI0034CD8761